MENSVDNERERRRTGIGDVNITGDGERERGQVMEWRTVQVKGDREGEQVMGWGISQVMG